MQPVLTQVPPNSLRSTSATFIPADVSRPASDGPACPAPITMASKISVMVLAHDECCVGDCTGVLQRGGKRSFVCATIGYIRWRWIFLGQIAGIPTQHRSP